MSMYIEDTIAAISTPPGQGGIGIVRVSGPDARSIGRRLFRFARGDDFASHHLHYGVITDDAGGDAIDEAMAVLMSAPRSYTREDVLEIHCHGGLLVVERVLAVVLKAGARLAEPGEFTRRAFLNGRIDLLEAEAVMDVITSRSEASLALARKQQDGALSRRIGAVRDSLRQALALLEAFIDFPEDDIGTADTDAIRNYVYRSCIDIDSLVSRFDEGRIMRDGIAALIVGKPNAGKSSLLNLLLGQQRAIVTHIAGTTRDIIEETASFGGLAVRLLDTAGIRHTDDVVEQEGIDRALECIPLADLVLFVLDMSRPFDHEDGLILSRLSGKTVLLVCNKSDLVVDTGLPPELDAFERCMVSSHTGQGIEELKARIRSTFLGAGVLDSREFVAISRARHRDALVSARQVLAGFLDGLAGGRELETLSIDLRDALDAVGRVTGETTPDDVLDIIFSSFCIGK